MKTLVLDTTTKKLQMVMSGAAATTNPSYIVSYADVTTSFTEGNLNGALNGTTPVDIVPAPAASTRRTVTEIVLYNADTAPVTVTLQIDDNGTDRVIKSIYLAAGETWEMSTQTAIDGAPGADGASSDYLSVLVNTEVSITGTDTATISKQHVCSGSSNYTVTLPAASGNTGKFLSFRFTNTGVTTLDGNGAETIDGVATCNYYQGQAVTLYCDGSNWQTINANTFPRGGIIFADTVIPSTAMTKQVDTSQRYNYRMYQSSAANGDYGSHMVWINKGTYTMTVHGSTGTNTAKIDWTLNGTSVTTGQDWYSASSVSNVEKTSSLTVPYSGYHTLKWTVNGKNASSSAYFFAYTSITIIPTAY